METIPVLYGTVKAPAEVPDETVETEGTTGLEHHLGKLL